jgi:hypothetical protein
MQTKKFLTLLPKTVKIGPHTWTLSVSPETGDTPDGVMPNHGLTRFTSQQIFIHPDLANSATVVGVLIHELYHAALFSFGRFHPKKEEDGALFVETMMTTIFRDNPTLLDIIKKGLK